MKSIFTQKSIILVSSTIKDTFNQQSELTRLYIIFSSTMNKKTLDKLTQHPNYNNLLFTSSIKATQALQQLIAKVDALSTNDKKALIDKQRQLQNSLKNTITTLGKFADIQKAPLATPIDHSLQIFESISDSIQMSVQKYREQSKNGTLEKPNVDKKAKDQAKRPQDNFKDIKPARYEFHSHEKDLSNIRTDLSFTKSRSIEDSVSYVASEKDLEEMIKDLSVQAQIAVDVQHSNKSYQGFTCLIQVSTRDRDYIVDPFSIWSALPSFNAIMMNPAIIKVMHGAEMDTKWLQRDFNIHIHNLFDTYRAARTLGLPKLSYAYLLTHYCSVTTDKTFQTADWRQRPLSQDMLHYARVDTHYLLQIFDRLRADIHQKALSMSLNPSEAFADVYSASHEVTKNEVQLYDFTKKQCMLQLSKEYKGQNYQVFLQMFRIIDQIAQENDIPFDELVTHRLEKQIIAKLKELLLVKPESITIKIDRLIADLRLIQQQAYIRDSLPRIKQYLTNFFNQRKSQAKNDKKENKPSKPIIAHLIEDLSLTEKTKKKTLAFSVAFNEFETKTYENLNANPFGMITFEPIAGFLAARIGVAAKEQQEKIEDEAQQESEQVSEENLNEEPEEGENEGGVIEFKRINPNVIYTVEDAAPIEEKYKPRKKRKEEDYEKKMEQKQKNIFELLQD